MSTETSPQLTSKIAVIGAGSVGSTVAYSLILGSVAGEILLVDPQKEVRDGQVQDLSDATYHSGSSTTRMRAAEHKEAGQCDIIVMTAGAAQKEGESRTDLVGKNLKILKSAIEDCKPFKKDAVLLLVTNPVDILTHFAIQYSGLPSNQVIGSGTFLDSARLRGILAEKTGIAATSIMAYVLGEHGDSQMVAWSSATIGGVPMDTVVEKEQIDREAVAKDTRTKAAAISDAKGATAFGVGGIAASICKSILTDQRAVHPISHYQKDFDCTFSMPAVLGRKGITKTIPISLNENEQKELKKSTDSLLEIIKDAEKE